MKRDVILKVAQDFKTTCPRGFLHRCNHADAGYCCGGGPNIDCDCRVCHPSTEIGSDQYDAIVRCTHAEQADICPWCEIDRLKAPLLLFLRQWDACGPNSEFGRYFGNVRDAAVSALGR
jgi:hypothetical protein